MISKLAYRQAMGMVQSLSGIFPNTLIGRLSLDFPKSCFPTESSCARVDTECKACV